MGALKAGSRPADDGRLSGQEAAWTMTEAANEPYFNLVQRYVFAPYFAATLASSQAEGASLWAFALGAVGLAIAVLAPVLGSIADSGSRLKPWLAAVSIVTALFAASLWFATPDVSLWLVLIVVFVAGVSVELMNQFANAFLPGVANPRRYGMLSGIAFGFSQLAGIAVLLIIIAVGRNPPAFLADVPNAVDRLAGPIAAVAVALFIVPFLLVARETGVARDVSVRGGLRDLRATLKEAWADRNMRFFLISRMISADGMAIVFGFGAVLAAVSFGWKADSLAIFGIIITVFGAIGGFLGGWLDRIIGSRLLILWGIALLAFGAASVLLTDEARLFGISTGVSLGAPLSTPQEWGFLGSGAIIAVGAAFALSGMRALMALLAPAGKVAAFFGLYAFVGKATAFVGPFLVGVIAATTGSVRPGIGIAVLFLMIGFAAMVVVRSPNARVA